MPKRSNVELPRNSRLPSLSAYFKDALSLRSKLLVGLVLVITFAIGFLSRQLTAKNPNPEAKSLVAETVATSATVRCKSGPWGELEYVPITIEAPEQLIPLQAMMDNPTRWFFKGFAREDLEQFIESLDLAREQKNAFLSSDSIQVSPGGVEVTPAPTLIQSLTPKAREIIFKLIAGFPENAGYFTYVRTQTLEERFKNGRVSDSTAALFQSMCCNYGEYLIFSGMPCVLATIPTNEERIRFVRVLTQQKSLLVKLRVNSDSDIEGLTRYWDKVGDSVDVKALLEAMATVKGGAELDLVRLLPSFPAAKIYTFPKRHTPRVGAIKRDCHWTAFNFFNETPDDGYVGADQIRRQFTENYVRITDSPRYGDLILFVRPNGTILHSAIYIADDISYTKNGDTPIHPWMFSTISDLVEQYSFMLEPGQRFVPQYFRLKDK